MPTFTYKLEKYLIHHYALNHINATIMIEDEWEYIEEYLLQDDISLEYIAQELVDIYMAA